MSMFVRFRSFTLLGLALPVLFSCAALAQGDASTHLRKYKAPPPAARIEVTVVKDVNGKPVEDAAVIFHPIEGDRDKGSLELKTNEDGKAIIDVIPIGDTVRLQIIAKGFQTYGGDYVVDKDKLAWDIRLKRPGEQYSAYPKPASQPDKGQNPPSGDKPSGDGSSGSQQK